MTHFHIDRIPKTYLLLFLFLTACLFYSNSLSNGYNLDDELVTQGHPLTSQGLSAIPKIFSSPFYQDDAGTSFEYRPVLLATFALEHQFFGESPAVSHAVNILLYGLTVLLMFWLLQAMVSPANKLLPFMASLIFIVHPIHTEVVNNIKSRDELLALAFSLVAVLLFLKKTDKYKTVVFFLGGCLAFALALLSKLSALPFALLIPVALVLFRQVSFLHLLFAILCTTSISFALFSRLVIKPPVIFYAGLLLLPILLHALVRYNLKTNLAGQKYLLFDHSLSSFQVSLVAIALGLMGVTVIFNNPFSLFAALLIIVAIFFAGKEKERLLTSILLAVFGLFSTILFHFNFIHLICLVPLLVQILSAGWQQNRVPAGIFLLVLLSGAAHDFLYNEGIGLINLLVIGALFAFGLRSNIKWKYTSIALLSGMAVVTLYFQVYVITLCFLLPAAFLFLKLKGRPLAGFRVVLTGAVLAAAFTIFTSQNPLLYSNEPYPAARITEQPVLPGQRVLDLSENHIMYEPSAEKRVATSLLVAGKYLQLLIVPYPLRFYYGYNMIEITNFKNPGVILSVAAILFLTGLTIYFIRKKPLIAFSFLLLLLGIFQFSNLLIPVAGVMGERLIYAASLGYSILLAVLFLKIYDIGKRIKISHWPAIGTGVMVSLVTISAVYVYHRNQQWKNPITLYNHDISYLSQSAKAYNILANESFKQALLPENINTKTNLLNEAVFNFKKCIEIYPQFPFTWLDLGNAYLALGDPIAALEAFEYSTKVDSHHGESYFKTAGLYESTGDFFKAEEYYRLAIDKNPYLKEAYFNLSALYFSQQMYKNGFDICDKALSVWPDEPGFLLNKGNALAGLGEYVEAVKYFEKAMLQRPDDADLIKKIIYLCDLVGDVSKAETYRKMLQ